MILALGTSFAYGMSDSRESHSFDSVAVSPVHPFGLDAAARYRFMDAGALGVRGAGRGGAAAIVDGNGKESVTQWGPLGALSVGHEMSVAGAFALALELQASLIGFSDQGASYPEGSEARAWYTYGTSSWLGLGLVGSLGI